MKKRQLAKISCKSAALGRDATSTKLSQIQLNGDNEWLLSQIKFQIHLMKGRSRKGGLKLNILTHYWDIVSQAD